MKKKIITFLLLFLTLFSITSNVNAKSLYGVEEKLTLTDEYDGTTFFAAETLTSKASINGIAFLLGNTVKVNGELEYGALAGNVVNIDGTIKNDLFVAGSNINITDTSVIRDSYMISSLIEIDNSTFGRNLRIAASTITLNDVTIDGSLYLSASTINIEDNVVIKGKLMYNDDATISGLEDNEINSIKTYTETKYQETIYTQEKNILYSIISCFIVLTILNLLFPNLIKKIDKIIKDYKAGDYLNNACIGFIILVIVPILCIITLLTYILMPVSIISMILYGLSMYIAPLISSYILGSIILTKCLKKEENFYSSILIGLLIIKEITLIPVIGSLVSFMSLLIGLGILLKLFNKKYQN